MKKWTVCFLVSGGVTIEAETEDEALSLFNSEQYDAIVQEELLENYVDVTEIFEEE